MSAIKQLASEIKLNGKTIALLQTLKTCFAELKRLNLPTKAIIFTDNRTTQNHLYDLLQDNNYKGILKYSGDNSRDYTIMDIFRNDEDVQILIATDGAAKGLDIEFCPIVVNYDLIYNIIEMEQRISRCHRLGQTSDVLVINFLGKDNFSDVRIMELINKRVLQFDGIFGMSDDIIGNFDVDIKEILQQLRKKADIAKSFEENLSQHRPENIRLIKQTEDILFTTFTTDIAEKVTIMPKYIEEQVTEFNRQLWLVVKWYFEAYNKNYNDCFFEINDQEQTITATNYGNKLPTLFYYWTGSRNKRYQSLKQYGMNKDFKPHHGRISPASVIVKGILRELSCPVAGTIVIDENIEPCTIGLYGISFANGSDKFEYMGDYNTYTFVGNTQTDKILTDDECRAILELPVVKFAMNENCKEWSYHNFLLSENLVNRDPFDNIVPIESIKEQHMLRQQPENQEEISILKHKSAIAKTKLERSLNELEDKIKVAEQQIENATDRLVKIELDKELKMLRKSLKRQEDGLFLDGMRLDLELENQIRTLTDTNKLKVKAIRQFIIQVESIYHGGKYGNI